ncbi:glutathione-regulated potassium-efflux system ancillary protein KefF [Cricetibacter osteomyelitidis]|uniref:Glutathione-regulated potassium-efflux system ancillary protein KefF n=1 Tax=Cricetibacter osteomyelitidis TaxID=1521931 RepID=A0A4R2SSM0_9PAST|nr:NAD(P)H-dependent oxidoreductase [Cricetibacter osteomyelitidis]TCP92175.1 glutathione-regulated potassium-efflux system ancillary protein KefF [Cricetibacter osteomyelitidis]
MKTLLVVSHPNFAQSRVIKALAEAAGSLQDVEIRNIDVLYGKDFTAIDVEAEKAAHERADRIVYLFPIHWFNLTPMLKAYMNSVWQYGWAFGEGGFAFAGKELQIIAAAGAADSTYQHDGLVRYTGAEVLAPLEASAYYTSFTYNQPLFFTSSNAVSDEGLQEWQRQVIERLQSAKGSNVKGVSTRQPQ